MDCCSGALINQWFMSPEPDIDQVAAVTDCLLHIGDDHLFILSNGIDLPNDIITQTQIINDPVKA